MCKSSELLVEMELVQNIANPDILKISGTDITFAKPTDEFSRKVISEIPNMIRYLKMVSNLDTEAITEENRMEIIRDVKDYLGQFFTVADIYLRETPKYKDIIIE